MLICESMQNSDQEQCFLIKVWNATTDTHAEDELVNSTFEMHWNVTIKWDFFYCTVGFPHYSSAKFSLQYNLTNLFHLKKLIQNICGYISMDVCMYIVLALLFI